MERLRTVAAAVTIGLCAGFCGVALGQTVYPIRSIESGDTRYADLGPIKEAIGDARVVVLAEATAGDGASILAKSRLVRWLWEEHGYDLVVFESGFFEVWHMDQVFLEGGDLRDALQVGVDNRWALSGHAMPVFELAWLSYFGDDPLRLAGLDPVSSLGAMRDPFSADIRRYLTEFAPGVWDADQIVGATERIDVAERALAAGDDDLVVDAWLELTSVVEAYATDAPALAEAAKAAGNEPEQALFWKRALEDRLSDFERRMTALADDRSVMSSQNERQQRMGDHLVWLATERFPDRKMIVWCEGWTAMAQPDAITAKPRPIAIADAITAGSIWNEALGDEVYTIGFTSHEGTTGRADGLPEPLPASKPGSIEAQLAELKQPFAFAEIEGDLAGVRPSKLTGVEVVMRGQGDEGQFELTLAADWSAQLDAVFFIRRMFPSTEDGSIPLRGVLRDTAYANRERVNLGKPDETR
ncbi:MAG: erythromycin esterase family protein [Planctomycetota bacterium]